MVNGSAVHPGDIVTAANGTTIEINNTDAEGRLTLADALLYACEQKPDAVVDLATLTGACVVALGDEMAGYWSNNEALAEARYSRRRGWRRSLAHATAPVLQERTEVAPGRYEKHRTQTWGFHHSCLIPQGIHQPRHGLGPHRYCWARLE